MTVHTDECILPGMPRLVQLLGFECERCGYQWVPRNIDQPPRVCPKCKSPYWDRPRRSPATSAPAPAKKAKKAKKA